MHACYPQENNSLLPEIVYRGKIDFVSKGMQTYMRNYVQRTYTSICIDFKGLLAGFSFQIQRRMVIFERDWGLMILEIEFWGTQMGTR
jgi:hypothetical protein